MTDEKKTIIYVTREIERALGMTPNTNYHIVSNKTPYGETIKKLYPDSITLIEGTNGTLLGTTDLLGHEITRALVAKINENSQPPASIIVFKNTLRVEAGAAASGWQLLNPKSMLSERVENKLSQLRWLGNLGTKYLPSHTAKVAKLITWKNDPFVVQWAHGHTGDGTMLVRTSEDLASIVEKFPERMARLTTYIKGPSFTVNVVISRDRILMSNVSYQITGLSPFTDNEFSTIGNDWGVARKLLSSADIQFIQGMVHDIGVKLQLDGWRGLFGIDLIRDENSKKIYLIEINARQPASSTFESYLQERERERGVRGLTTFEAHIRALQELPISEDLIEIRDGAQIIQRLTRNIQGIFDDVVNLLETSGYQVVTYQNSTPNSDLLRIQSTSSILDNHNILNTKGREIAEKIRVSRINIQV